VLEMTFAAEVGVTAAGKAAGRRFENQPFGIPKVGVTHAAEAMGIDGTLPRENGGLLERYLRAQETTTAARGGRFESPFRIRTSF